MAIAQGLTMVAPPPSAVTRKVPGLLKPALIVAVLVSGCETLALAGLGVGGTAAVNHKMTSTPTRTFTASLTKVKLASIGALKRMGINAD